MNVPPVPDAPRSLPSAADAPSAVAPPDPGRVPPLSRVPDWLLRAGTSAWLLIGLSIVLIGAFLALSRLSSLVAPLVVAAVMGMLFFPLVDRLAARGVPRSLGASAVMLGLVLIVALSLLAVVRGVINEGSSILASIEQGWVEVTQWLAGIGVDVSDLSQVTKSLGSAGAGIGGLVGSTFSSFASLSIGLFIGTFLLFYLLMDWHTVSRWVAAHLGVPRDLGSGLIDDATWSIRRHFYGLTVASIVVAIFIGLAMWALGVPLAFTIALVTFVTAYIPYIGAIVAGAFACLIALGDGGVTLALIVLAIVVFTQNVVQTVVQTKLTSDQLSLHPIVNLGSTIVGATLAGVLGATLSAPVVAMVIAARKRLLAYYSQAAPSPSPSPSPSPGSATEVAH